MEVRQGRMIKASISLQELRRKIYRKAQAGKQWRFWGLYCHVCKKEVLREAYRLAKANDGAPGIDGKSFEDIEADFKDCSYGYRPKRHAHQAIDRVTKGILHGLTRVVDVDLSGYFDNIRHHLLLERIARRVQDDDIMHLVKLILKANGEKGVPQGGIISPLLSNLYLNEVDEMMERAREVTRRNGYYNLEFIRSADDMVILIHGHPKEDWLLQKVQKRLKEELDTLQVQMNREKTKVVNLREGGCYSFLGFDFRLNRNRKGKTYVSKTPRKKKRQEIGKKIKAALKANWNKPFKEVIQTVNAIIRGWVNYFRIGNSNSTFNKVRNYIEMKVRKFVMRRKKLKG
ncbi:MAG: group II intron reverse transcriptase/maturase, partial [Candidatus Brocadia sp.]|nr:group II intron reverse transcriptase/maturase [Candidatus Brocadia sp.]